MQFYISITLNRYGIGNTLMQTGISLGGLFDNIVQNLN
jgi:hypothetical protein